METGKTTQHQKRRGSPGGRQSVRQNVGANDEQRGRSKGETA